MSLLKGENKELMRLDIYEDYDIMEVGRKKIEPMKGEEEKTGKLL